MQKLSADLKFPQGFLWGAATSAHQVEGNNHNDWSEWEHTNAQRLAAQSAERFAGWMPSWEGISSQANSASNYISGNAADHYNNYVHDLDLLKLIGLNSYRFSIEWSRIEPEFGKFDFQEIAHYQKIIDACHSRNILPLVTLWHWTIPTWFRNIGGWRNSDGARYFADYVSKLVASLKGVNMWITLNEPHIYASQAFLIGDWPPQQRSQRGYLQVLLNLITAHRLAYETIHQIHPGSQVSIADNHAFFDPLPANFVNKIAAQVGRWWYNHFFLSRITKHLDFIGLNYYFRRQINLTPFMSRPTHSYPTSDMGWELYPQGLEMVLLDLQKYKKPIYITEHGLADANDSLRAWYIAESLKAVGSAIHKGSNVRGYFHWSLIDNFEWDKGFWPRFGLIEVDYSSQKRTIRPSANIFSEITRTSELGD